MNPTMLLCIAAAAGFFFTAADAQKVETGATEDATALQDVFDSSYLPKIVLPKGKAYALESKLSIPAGLEVDFNGSTVSRISDDVSSAFQIEVGAGAVIRNLTLRVPAGVSINRGINLADGAKAYDVKIISRDQQANTGSQQHAAFNINGDATEVRGLTIANFDSALRCEGDSTDGVWSNITVSSYVQAFDLDVCRNFSLSDYFAKTRSPNARTKPGHNGLTMRGARFGKLSNLDIRDSGEHGIYLAGCPVPQQNLRFSNVRVTRPGQSGFKIRNTAATSTDISIDGLSVIDAHFGNRAGTNEDGLRIERAEDVVVTGFSVRRKDNAASSAYDGIYITASRNIRIIKPDIRDVENTGIRIDDEGSGQTLDNIVVDSPSIIGTLSGHGIAISAATTSSELRNIFITDAYIAAPAGYAVRIDTTDRAIVQPVSINGTFRSPGMGVYQNVNGNTDLLLNVRLDAPAEE
jgi:hypothetical protein